MGRPAPAPRRALWRIVARPGLAMVAALVLASALAQPVRVPVPTRAALADALGAPPAAGPVALAGPAEALAPPLPAEVEALAAEFRESVDRQLEVPQSELPRYAALADAALADAGISLGQEFVLLVDRSPAVQALLLLWHSPDSGWALLGASPVSTGRPGSFDHFATPLGVFRHSPSNPDFRAEGTFNENHIRGYGLQGLRVFDFGWQAVPKGWGDHAVIEMRLQLHATDPDLLEQRLGTAQSKGCIRIPASLNRLLDVRGVLDADYDALAREGRHLWVLPPDRSPLEFAGRWLVVVDSGRAHRPPWSPPPRTARPRR